MFKLYISNQIYVQTVVHNVTLHIYNTKASEISFFSKMFTECTNPPIIN